MVTLVCEDAIQVSSGKIYVIQRKAVNGKLTLVWKRHFLPSLPSLHSSPPFLPSFLFWGMK
jgi:hypothetical protein